MTKQIDPTIVTPEMLQTRTRVTMDIECLHDVDMKHFKFSDAEFLEIAIACTVNHEGEVRDFTRDEAFRFFGHMNQHNIICGYNTLGFDYPLIGGQLLAPQNPASKRFIENTFKGRTIDLLKDFQEALGHRISLANVSVPTLGDHKEMDGGFAPEMWRKGKKMEVIEYCRGDIRRTDALLVKAVNGEELKYMNKGGDIKTFKTKVKLR